VKEQRHTSEGTAKLVLNVSEEELEIRSYDPDPEDLDQLGQTVWPYN
jgi:hypothetical protein